MKNSCIPHPEREPLIMIRRWQLDFAGDACAAALLSFFEYWHNNKLDNQDKKPGASLVQHHTSEELHAGIMGLYSRDSIRKAVAKLEKLGVLQVSRNPRAQFGFDRTKHYLFKPEIARNWLKMNTTAKNRTSNCEKSSFPTAKNRQTIPETTSETSYPEKTKETKETSFCSKTDGISVSASVSISDSRTKEQKLASVKPPRNIPSEREFNNFMEDNPDECDIISEYRPDLWLDLCRDKWHKWRKDIKKWVPVRDWRAYVLSFGERMNGDHPKNN